MVKKLNSGKIRVIADVQPDVYAAWKDSGLFASKVFEAGLERGLILSKLTVVSDMYNKALDEINKRNQTIYILNEKVKEYGDKLVIMQLELDKAKALIQKAGIKEI